MLKTSFRKLMLFLSLIAISLPFFFFPHKAHAESFAIDTSVEYQFASSGTAHITYSVKLKNLTTEFFASSFTINSDNLVLKNVKAYQNNIPLKVDVVKKENTETLKINFPDQVTGKDSVRDFNLQFDVDTLATRTGEVWEIVIPKVEDPDSYSSYNVALHIPKLFGKLAYIAPNPLNSTETDIENIYYFDKATVKNTGISAGFGDFQVFSFDLSYHLENPLSKSALTEITLPPDTNSQRIYYQTISPKPQSINLDSDGNWIARYKLKPRERVDINTKGSVQIFSKPRKLLETSPEKLKEYLKPTQYWQTSDARIQKLAQELKTPEAIYKYVTTTLTYDYSRVKPNVVRLGASGVLDNPRSAICMEFTDLFIAIARAAGIPAREINGFAYTENPEIQPLSLVADVLHAWPEYYDVKQNVWIPIDPTWGSTTGGVDYFTKLDLRHFTFVIHGIDPVKPYAPGSYKLGSNPQKDVYVNFGQLPTKRQSMVNLSVNIASPLVGLKVNANAQNEGPIALYNLPVQLYFDGIRTSERKVDILFPFTSFSFTEGIPSSFLGLKTPDKVTVMAAGSEKSIYTHKEYIVLYNLVALFILLAVVILFVLIFTGRIKLSKGKKVDNENKKNTISQGSSV